ncbi:hypothetical protein MJM13_12115, partial [Salmonella enterica subsp. enterica serovar Kentucky]|nr:hypothetical protein [Salmonella enterica subsp. enterica serovar Kentucky]
KLQPRCYYEFCVENSGNKGTDGKAQGVKVEKISPGVRSLAMISATDAEICQKWHVRSDH